jgi:hypothetical protein
MPDSTVLGCRERWCLRSYLTSAAVHVQARHVDGTSVAQGSTALRTSDSRAFAGFGGATEGPPALGGGAGPERRSWPGDGAAEHRLGRGRSAGVGRGQRSAGAP